MASHSNERVSIVAGWGTVGIVNGIKLIDMNLVQLQVIKGWRGIDLEALCAASTA